MTSTTVPDEAQQATGQARFAQSHLNKKRFYTMRERLQELSSTEDGLLHIHLDGIMDIICSVCHFDPEAKVYKPEMAQRMKEYMHKKQEENGASSYTLRNQRAYYEKNKDVLNKRRTENRRAKVDAASRQDANLSPLVTE